ncbi:hypothetical protein [Kocuria sp.]|uniref:hypothetical protein n=1 Tax=Kocuria sp. TaxID=1871328 RepID=UPI0026E0B3E8|nr:hypothetical protein [Kocuria sp.]MDO5619312.1 hypothetical protein [Kocuria sp.]
MSTCIIPKCNGTATARGLCDAHLARQRLGIPMDSTPIRRAVPKAERAKQKAEARELRAQGWGTDELAELYGVSRTYMGQWVAGIVPPAPIPHGQPSAWVHHKCDCDICREAKRAYKRAEYRKRQERGLIVAPHGTVRAYNQGCSCEACRAAVAEKDAQRQERTRPTAHNHGKRWTGADAEIAHRTDLTIEQRAVMLGRTHAAVDDFLRDYGRRSG